MLLHCPLSIRASLSLSLSRLCSVIPIYADVRTYDGAFHLTGLDTEFLRLATMGLTVLAASGDDGPNNDGAAMRSYRRKTFNPFTISYIEGCNSKPF